MKTSIFLGAFFALTVLAFGQETKIDLHHEGYFNMPDSTPLRGVYYVKDSTWYTYDTSYVFAAVAHPTRYEYSELRLIPAISINCTTHHLIYTLCPEPVTFKFYYLFSREAGQEIKGVLMTFPMPVCDLTKRGNGK
jgi:hypothetical protein